MKKITDFLTVNIFWKIAALIIAAVLWFLAINIEDPMDSKGYLVQVQIRNMDTLEKNGLVLLNEEEIKDMAVMVRVRANTKTLTTKLSTSKVIAYIDMSPVNFTYSEKVGEVLTPLIQVELPDNTENYVTSYTVVPSTVGIVLDYYHTEELPVTVVKTTDAAQGHVSMEPVVTPATVKVSGAQSIIDTIQSVRVAVALDNAAGDYVTFAKPVVYDINNEEITDRLEIDTTEVEISVAVNKSVKIPVKTPTISGFVADGYTITNVSKDVESVEVVGKDEEIDSVSEIVLDAIDVNGRSESFTVPRDVRDFLRNTNLSVRNGTPHEVNITVTIEKETVKEFTIPVSRLNIINEQINAEYEDSVSFNLKGIERVISLLNNNNISGSIDLTGLSVGAHNVPVVFELPDGVTIVGEEPVIKVVITEDVIDNTEETQNNSESEGPVEYPPAENTPLTPIEEDAVSGEGD